MKTNSLFLLAIFFLFGLFLFQAPFVSASTPCTSTDGRNGTCTTSAADITCADGTELAVSDTANCPHCCVAKKTSDGSGCASKNGTCTPNSVSGGSACQGTLVPVNEVNDCGSNSSCCMTTADRDKILPPTTACSSADGKTGTCSTSASGCIGNTTSITPLTPCSNNAPCCAAVNNTPSSSSSATQSGLVPCGNGNSPANACTLCHFIIGFHNLVDFGLKLLVTLTVVGIFISGVIYIISAGNEQLLTQAKTFLSASLIGFTVVLAAWLLVNVIMWALSYNTSVIQQTNWWTFTCSTASATTQAAQTTQTNPTGTVGAACSALPNQVPTQCGDASAELNTLTQCIAGKLNNNVQITSVSDGNGGLTCYQSHPTWSQCPSSGGSDCCYHAKNSCHYGGTCGGASLAVDLKPYNGSTDSTLTSAITDCGGRPNPEGTHVHASVQTSCCTL